MLLRSDEYAGAAFMSVIASSTPVGRVDITKDPFSPSGFEVHEKGQNHEEHI